MKNTIYTFVEINVHGKERKYCGSDTEKCRFSINKFGKGEICSLFFKKIKHDSIDFLRCSKCLIKSCEP
jgi:hypothetical protein